MSYLLYYSPDSANVGVRMALEELGVYYDHKEVPRRRADRDADFLKLSPRGLLPVLVDRQTGAVVSETAAVLLYLADRHGRLAPAPDEPAARAELLRWLFMLSNTLHADLVTRFYGERYVKDEAAIPEHLEITERRVLDHFALLDRLIGASGCDCLLSWGLSVCDFYLGCCLRWAQMYPVGRAIDAAKFASFPHLLSAMTVLQQRPSVNRALQKEGLSGPAFVNPVTHLPQRIPDPVGTLG